MEEQGNFADAKNNSEEALALAGGQGMEAENGTGSHLRLKLLHEVEGHTDRVWNLAWSPVVGLLASCGGDKCAKIWEQVPSTSSSSAAWRCKAVLDETHTGTVRSCHWSPNGRFLATASFDATVGIWEYAGGQFRCISTLEGHENEVKSVAWNASGMFLATCSRDKHVWIWELQPGNEFECVSVLSGHSQDVKMVTWHPSRDVLVSASYDNSIKVWKGDIDGDDWICVQTLGEPGPGHTSTVWALSFDSNGDRLVSCSDDLTLMVWDATDDSSETSESDHRPWRHLYTITGYHDRTIFSVHWSSANGLIASGAADNCVRIFSESRNQRAVDGDNFALVVKKVKAHSTDVNCVRWHPTDPRLLASGSDDGAVKIWELVGDLDFVI